MKPYKLQKFEATVAQHDRLQTNSEMHDMRYRIYREMRDRFIREEKAKVAQAYAFSNKLFEDRSGFVFKCVWCGSPMQVRRSTKRTCSSRCRTQLNRLPGRFVLLK